MGKPKIVTRMGKGVVVMTPLGFHYFLLDFSVVWYQMKGFYIFSTVQENVLKNVDF